MSLGVEEDEWVVSRVSLLLYTVRVDEKRSDGHRGLVGGGGESPNVSQCFHIAAIL